MSNKEVFSLRNSLLLVRYLPAYFFVAGRFSFKSFRTLAGKILPGSKIPHMGIVQRLVCQDGSPSNLQVPPTDLEPFPFWLDPNRYGGKEHSRRLTVCSLFNISQFYVFVRSRMLMPGFPSTLHISATKLIPLFLMM